MVALVLSGSKLVKLHLDIVGTMAVSSHDVGKCLEIAACVARYNNTKSDPSSHHSQYRHSLTLCHGLRDVADKTFSGAKACAIPSART